MIFVFQSRIMISASETQIGFQSPSFSMNLMLLMCIILWLCESEYTRTKRLYNDYAPFQVCKIKPRDDSISDPIYGLPDDQFYKPQLLQCQPGFRVVVGYQSHRYSIFPSGLREASSPSYVLIVFLGAISIPLQCTEDEEADWLSTPLTAATRTPCLFLLCISLGRLLRKSSSYNPFPTAIVPTVSIKCPCMVDRSWVGSMASSALGFSDL